jgi:hypothetical protein
MAALGYLSILKGKAMTDSLSNNEDRPKRGRPRKTDLVSNKRGSRGVRGRPKGDAAIINEYKARMLSSPKSAKVLEAIFDAALNDDHKNQAAAWKLVMDRVLPTAAFEKDIVKGSGKNSISINITGVGATTISSTSEESSEQEDYIEGDYSVGSD